jgi:hypothetical protein
MKLCVYARMFYETPYINCFIEHYVKLGFDKIILIKVDNIDYKCPKQFNKYVEIHNRKNEGDNTLDKHKNLIRKSKCDWCFVVDIDELLLINKKYNNIKAFIREKQTKNKSINRFYFRWNVIEKMDNNFNNNLRFIVTNYNIYHARFVKCMFKINRMNKIKAHTTSLTIRPLTYFEGNILHVNNASRFNKSKNTDKFNDISLLHIHTRSSNNLVMKSLVAKLINKNIYDKKSFIDMVNNIDTINKLIPTKKLQMFKNVIGIKAQLPYCHSANKISKINIYNFRVYSHKYKVIDIKEQNILLRTLLQKINITKINYDKYIKIIDTINIKSNLFIKKKD